MQNGLTLLSDISLGIIFATAAAHLARLVRQPPILGYVLGGILLGTNIGLGLVTSTESIELISEIGLILLLFIIGLEIDLRKLIGMGKSMLTLGIVQFVACALITAGFFGLAGYSNGANHFDLLYLSVALALSSTLIVVKLLYDKHEITLVAGQLTVGVLVLQDIWAIIFMAFQPNLLSPHLTSIAQSLGLGLVLVALAFGASRFILPRLFVAAGKNPELIVLTAVAWCFSICSLAEAAGLSREMGALIAGMSIASFPYGVDVASKISGVRDFFVTLFFVALGLKMPAPTWPLVGVSFFAVGVVLISRLLSVIPTAVLLGRGLHTGAVTAINLSQISEFSLVIVALGVGFGHVTADIQTMVLTSMLTASVVGTYLITFNDTLARILVKTLGLFGVRSSEERDTLRREGKQEKRDIILLGCFREGMGLLDSVAAHAPELRRRILVIDYNPALESVLRAKGFVWMYGDIAQPETLQHLHVGHASVIVCSVSDSFLKGTTNVRLLEHLKRLAPDARFIMTADDQETAEKLQKSGACHVMMPASLAGTHLLKVIRARIS